MNQRFRIRSFSKLILGFGPFLQTLDNRPSVILFPLIAVVILWINIRSRLGLFWDAAHYFELGLSFYRDGFSFLNYHETLRGYLFPFSLFSLQVLAKQFQLNDVIFFRVCFGLLVAAFITILIPAYFEALTRIRVAFIPRLVFALLVLYYWQGYFLYPLTDFPALMLLVAGMYSMLLALERFADRYWRRLFLILIAGCSIGASMIVRPAYQIVLIPILIYLPVRVFRGFSVSSQNVREPGVQKRVPPVFERPFPPFSEMISFSNIWPRLTMLGLFVSGMVISWLPQIYINYYNFGALTPFAIANWEGEHSLYECQLVWGIHLQRYETYIDPEVGNTASVKFWDQQGRSIISKEGITEYCLALGEYINLVLRYPVDFATIYFRHFFNGMDIAYNTPYLLQIDNNRILFSFLNYSMQFIFLGMVLVWLPSWIKKIEIIVHLVILVLPALLSLPGAVEIRFFLPLYLVMYVCVCYIFLPRFQIELLKKYLHILVPLYVLYILMCFSMSSFAFMGLEDVVYTLGD